MDGEGSELMPLRMVVEWVYCPRLFHYMHVEGVMVANHHVWRGRHAHRRADQPGKTRARRKLPVVAAADGEGDVAREPFDRPVEWQAARAVELGAPGLGLIAKLDGVLLDGAGSAIPTELKSGFAPGDTRYASLAAGVWDSDAVHVTLQAILLEANGYRVLHGEIYYAASGRLVRVELGEALRARALSALAGARAAAGALERPPPLVDSPKCQGCSLVGTCLPDESNALRAGLPPDEELGEGPVPPPRMRRLLAPHLEGRSVTVSTPGTSVKREEGALVVVPPPWEREARPVRLAFTSLDALAIVGTVQISTAAIQSCLDNDVVVSFHGGNGRLLGVVTAGLGNNIQLRIAQHAAAEDTARSLTVAREFVRAKLRNQRTLLRRNMELGRQDLAELDALLRAAAIAPDHDTLRGVEGRFARRYFEHFAALVEARSGSAMQMTGRKRRPPPDPPNALLSFGYAILSRECADAALRVGFDPMRGFLHAPGWGRPALALDLMEEFRPLVVDSTVLRVIAERRLGPEDFHRELEGVTLTPAARRTFLGALDQRREEEVTHPLFGYRISYRRAFELQARLLARVLDGEMERYVGLVTR